MIAPMLSGLERQLGSMQQQAYRPAAAALAPPAGSLAASGTPAAAVEAPAAPAVEPAVAEAPAQAAAAEEGPALQAAEVEIEAAVAAGMMQDAQEQLQGLRLQQPAAADVAAGAAEAPPAVAAGTL